jgi:hypothetical protein
MLLLVELGYKDLDSTFTHFKDPGLTFTRFKDPDLTFTRFKDPSLTFAHFKGIDFTFMASSNVMHSSLKSQKEEDDIFQKANHEVVFPQH